jgi:ABC-type nitrate/sulfonate/bicarbonate transport system ATPase subunit
MLAAQNVFKAYGSLEVLRGVSFELEENEAVALLGPSGCGKTTLLRILLGLDSLDAGDVVGSLDRAGYLPQEGLLFPWKTVLENTGLPLQLRGVERRARRREVRRWLSDFGLTGFETAYPHELSGGMRQRAALLRAVLTGSPVLVLDEPFGALDTITRHRMQAWLANLISDLRRTMLFVTHDVDEAIALAGRIVLLSERPARTEGEFAITLTLEDRASRTSRAFLDARDRLLGRIWRGRDG